MPKRYEYNTAFLDVHMPIGLTKAVREGWRPVLLIGRDSEGDTIFLIEREVSDDSPA